MAGIYTDYVPWEDQGIDRERVFWETYLEAAKDEDQARPREWEGNTGSILTFTGLFAATVAAFVIESYKYLTPDSGDQTVVLLAQILAAATNTTASSTLDAMPAEPFRASKTVIAANVLWFCSLTVALMSALLATLIQQWARDYVRYINREHALGSTARRRSFNHIFIRMGVNRYRADQVVYCLVASIHLSVALFFLGLVFFMAPINLIVAGCVATVMGLFLVAYLVASILPLVDKSCPYRTPLTYASAFAYWLYLRAWRYRLNFTNPFLYSHRLQRLTKLPSWHDIVSRQCDTLKMPPGWIQVLQERYTSEASAWVKFAMDHTYWHLMERRDSYHLMQSLLSLFGQVSSVVGISNCLDLLVNYEPGHSFLHQLHSVSEGSLPRPKPSLSDLYTLREICQWAHVILEHIVKKGNSAGHSEEIMSRLSVLYCMARSEFIIARQDEATDQRARLHLCNLRHTLLLFCHFAKCSPATTRELWLGHYPGHQTVFRLLSAKQLSLLLCSSKFEELTSKDCKWEDDRPSLTRPVALRSSLAPLHDDTCCTLQGSWLHLAACNILTMVSRIMDLEAADANRTASFLVTAGYGRLNTGPYHPTRITWLAWPEHLQLLERECPVAPSAFFVSILDRAGLSSWLEPGSRFDSKPPDLPHLRFLTQNFCPHVSPPPNIELTVLGMLRSLARCVDFTTARRECHMALRYQPPVNDFREDLVASASAVLTNAAPDVFPQADTPIDKSQLQTKTCVLQSALELTRGVNADSLETVALDHFELPSAMTSTLGYSSRSELIVTSPIRRGDASIGEAHEQMAHDVYETSQDWDTARMDTLES